MPTIRVAPGKTVGGRVEVENQSGGSSAAMSPLDSGGTFEADAETEDRLLRAIAECDEGRTTPIANVLADLRSRE